MASHASTPRSRSPSSTTSSGSSDATMHDAPPATPVRARPAQHAAASPLRSSTPSDPAFSLLLSLPRELRDRIYTFALVSAYPFWWPAPSSPTHNVAHALLRTSRQVHDEAAPLFYSLNKFLFTHPSDCSMFRVVASPYAEHINCVYMRIKEKDVKLWATYLGSTDADRSMKHDLPRLRTLWIFLRCGTMGTPGMINGLAAGVLPAALAAQVHAAHVFGQQIHQIQQQIQNQYNHMLAHLQGGPPTGPPPMPFAHFANGAPQTQPQPQNHNQHQHPPPPPLPQTFLATPGPALPPHMPPLPPQPHGFFSTLMRWEREMGLENLCLSLQETRPSDADVKIVCIVKLPKAEVQRLVRIYHDELSVDRNGDARTRFRRVHGLDVSLEVSGYDPQGPG